MKKTSIIAVAAALTLIAGGLGLAQGQGSYQRHKAEIDLTRAMVQTDRKSIVATNMSLSSEQREAFWPVYNRYRTAMAGVEDRRVKLITRYADAYVGNKLSDEQALALLNEFLSIERERLKVKRRYINQFKKVIPPKKVVRFFQVDHRLDTVINLAIAKNVPLVR
ncbi:MAG: hypothetical protein ACE5LB_01320 [Acidiferrobacterales bacterium]